MKHSIIIRKLVITSLSGAVFISLQESCTPATCAALVLWYLLLLLGSFHRVLGFTDTFAQKFVLKAHLWFLGLHSQMYSLESFASFHPCWPGIMLQLCSQTGAFSSAVFSPAVEGVERIKRAVVGELGKEHINSLWQHKSLPAQSPNQKQVPQCTETRMLR